VKSCYRCSHDGRLAILHGRVDIQQPVAAQAATSLVPRECQWRHVNWKRTLHEGGYSGGCVVRCILVYRMVCARHESSELVYSVRSKARGRGGRSPSASSSTLGQFDVQEFASTRCRVNITCINEQSGQYTVPSILMSGGCRPRNFGKCLMFCTQRHMEPILFHASQFPLFQLLRATRGRGGLHLPAAEHPGTLDVQESPQ
jgi:hypothetical protein